MDFDARDVMERLADQLHGRRSCLSANASPLVAAIAAWPDAGAVQPLAVKSEYVLSELLAFPDRVFVENAFQAVLRRRADKSELREYLGDLRSARLSKVELLGVLRWSAEGVARGTHVNGLLLPYTVRRWSRKRHVGPVISWFYGAFRLHRLLERADARAAALERDITSVGDRVNSIMHAVSSKLLAADRVAVELEQLGASSARVEGLAVQLDKSVATAADARAETAHAILQLREDVNGMLQRLEATEGFSEQLDEVVATATEARAEAAHSVSQLREDVDGMLRRLEGRVDELAHHTAAQGAVLAQAEARQAMLKRGDRALDSLYVAFEKRFRGSEGIIRQRLAPYIQVLRDAGAGSRERPVLDLGSGSGEWLQLVKEVGLVGRGVDTNTLFTELCKGQSLDVAEADVLEYLESAPDDSLGAITAMHLVEHLPFEVLVRVLDHARRALAPGGVLIMETPNPENLLVASHYFYLDPTHRNPLPPEMLRWIVESRGFGGARIERLTQGREMPRFECVKDEVAGAEVMNTMADLLQNAPDYAVIGYKL